MLIRVNAVQVVVVADDLIARIVGNLRRKFLVQRLVVLGLDPMLGRINHLVAVVVAHLLGVQALRLVQHVVVAVAFHHGRLPGISAR